MLPALLILVPIALWSLGGMRQEMERRARSDALREARSIAQSQQQALQRAVELAHPPVDLDPSLDREFALSVPLQPTGQEGSDADRLYEQALEALQRGQQSQAIRAFRLLLQNHPQGQTAAGTPIRPLILFHLFQADSRDAEKAARELMQAALYASPSLLSESLLEAANSIWKERYPDSSSPFAGWESAWKEAERVRHLLRQHFPLFSSDRRAHWMNGPDGQRWWIQPLPFDAAPADATRFVALTSSQIWRALRNREEPGDATDSLAHFHVQLGGEPSESPDGSEILARVNEGDITVTARPHAQEALLASWEKQRFWLVALILGAGLAGLLSLWFARRAVVQQMALNRLKSNFVSSVSHELRSPVASIRLMAEQLTEPASEDRRLRYAEFIEQESLRLSNLVENVLDFSRIEDGRKTYQFEPVDLNDLVSESAFLMEPHAAKAEVRILTETAPRPVLTSAARSDLLQALINLIDNALKFSPMDGTVQVGCTRKNGACEISVCDEGPGIPRSEQQHIFERFYRVGSEERRRTQGVGIGLSIVQHVVDAHQGAVRVESEVGKGCRFVMTLPVKDREVTDGTI